MNRESVPSQDVGLPPALHDAVCVFSHPPHLAVPSVRVGTLPLFLRKLRKQRQENQDQHRCV